jgi:putative glutamine amidotransferase
VGSPPVIGLSAYCEEARWGYWQSPAVLLPANYAEQVSAAGGVPVLLPPLPGVARAVDRLDGLLLTGGGDIDPGRYGAQPHPRTGRVSAPRDAAELELLDAAMTAGLPVLGVCRGMQLVNVARGGTLCQHLPMDAGHTPVPGTFGSHPVRVAPGTRLAGILGASGDGVHGANGDGVDVPTAHHQAVDRLGAGLVATAWTEDGVIEAVEPSTAGDPFLLAVQWHPEAGTDPRVIEALVAAASARMSLYTRQRD